MGKHDKVRLFNTDGESELHTDIPVVTARQEGATEIRVFILEEEKAILKAACDSVGTNMSHLTRRLLLQWLEKQDNQSREAS